MTGSTRRAGYAAAAAPAVFVFLWSTGFVVARYATDDAGPLTFLTVRVLIAGGVLALIAAVSGAPRPTRRGAAWSAVAGLGLQAAYLGGVFLAIDAGLPSGVSALIGALHPVVTAAVAGPLLGEHLRRIQWLGVGLGLAGVVAVVVDRLRDGTADVRAGAVIAVSVATLGMSVGTLVHRRRAADVPLLWGTVAQFASSAVVLGVGAVVVEGIEITFTTSTVWSLVWSVGVLSIAAVLTMMWLLGRRAAAKVSSLFFLFPALSAIEGAILFGERLGVLAVGGFALALLGVALTTRASTS